VVSRYLLCKGSGIKAMQNHSLLIQERNQAKRQVDQFVQCFSAGYRQLAYYAALPLVITPELLHYLKNQFLSTAQLSWAAEADLLLSDLFYPVGDDQYAMDISVRAYLITKLEKEFGADHLQSVASLLLRYVQHLNSTNPYLSHQELQSQQMAAMVYMGEVQQRQVAYQLAQAYQSTSSDFQDQKQAAVAHVELARLSRLTESLAPKLQLYPQLLAHARLVGQLITDPAAVPIDEIRSSYEVVEGIIVDVPETLRNQSSKISSESEKSFSTIDIVKDWINVSVFCPRKVHEDDMFLCQAFAYLPDQIEAVEEVAAMIDETAEQVAKKKLGMPIERDTDLTFDLVMSRLDVDESGQSLSWSGWEDSVTFDVGVPTDITTKTIIGKVTVRQKSVPLGRLTFKVQIEQGVVSDEITLAGDEPVRYKKAYISHSYKDRKEVLKRVTGLISTGIEISQECLTLSPRARWEQSVYKNIQQCDLFLLFWSSAARESEWVIKEAEYALELQKSNELGLPDIKPVILEGPPIPDPPEGLKDLPFNDKIIYLINQS